MILSDSQDYKAEDFVTPPRNGEGREGTEEIPIPRFSQAVHDGLKATTLGTECTDSLWRKVCKNIITQPQMTSSDHLESFQAFFLLQTLREAVSFYSEVKGPKPQSSSEWASIGRRLTKRYLGLECKGNHEWSAFTRTVAGRIRSNR